MNLSALDWAFWLGIFVGHLTLLSVLLFRGRLRIFPVFTAYIGFQAVWSVALYAINRYGSSPWYGRGYWCGVLLDFFLQLGVIWEIARNVMRPTGSWVRDARKQFILVGAAGILFAAALAWVLSPPDMSLLGRLNVRSSFFTSLVVCELFVAMMLTAKRLGLGFRNHVFALVLGWSAWVMAAMAVDLLQGYYGTHIHFDVFENVRKFFYLVSLFFWMMQFWSEEPARRELPPELRAYIEALHQRVKKDLDTLPEQR